MNNLCRLLSLSCISVFAASPLMAQNETNTPPAETADSVAESRASVLEELVVTGERAWIEGDKAVFVPTKKEKNLSTDPVSMVKRMHIPTVIVDRGEIKSLTGRTVAVFINGRRAEQIDLSTFWPKQAIRVEYMENPKDPKYEGEAAVINFVMHEYEYGGIVKASAEQQFPNSGDYDIASKLENRKMTYGLILNGGYSRDHVSSADGEESYRDIFYDGKRYGEISRRYASDPRSASDNAGVAFSARYYNPNKLRVVHNVSLNWKRDPGSGFYDSESWTPAIFPGESARRESRSRSISPALSGVYSMQLTGKTMMTASWNYKYSHNNSSSVYDYDGLDAILNATREDVHSGGVSLYCGSRLSPKFSLGGTLKSDMDWFRTRYTGSANQFVSQYRGSSSASVDLYFSLNDRLGFYVGPGLHLNYWHVGGGDDYSNVEPSGQLQVQWAPSNKSQFSVYGHYMSYAPGASQFSDVTLRQDELNWIAGNPALKNHHWMGATLIYLWMPRQNFRISNLISYDRQTKQVNYIFEPAPESMGGLIRRYMNGAAENMIKYQIDASLQLFDSDLSLYVSPDWSYTKVSGPYAGHNSWLRFRSGASYTVSNCEFSFDLSGKEKFLRSGGMERVSTRTTYTFGFTYGQGDIYLSLDYYETFSSKPCMMRTLTETQYYTSLERSYGDPRRLTVSLTYTFGFGKKVNRNIDTSRGSAAKTGVVGAD